MTRPTAFRAALWAKINPRTKKQRSKKHDPTLASLASHYRAQPILIPEPKEVVTLHPRPKPEEELHTPIPAIKTYPIQQETIQVATAEEGSTIEPIIPPNIPAIAETPLEDNAFRQAELAVLQNDIKQRQVEIKKEQVIIRNLIAEKKKEIQQQELIIKQAKEERRNFARENQIHLADPITIDTPLSEPDIIDIDTTYQPIDYQPIEVEKAEQVPTWAHTYVYGLSELDRATQQQRTYYALFKERFLDGAWIDLEGNTNYAFILLFDLLKDFDSHQDAILLEEQMNAISKGYPKTASYARRFLIDKLREIGDLAGVERLEWTVVSPNRTDYQSWDWKYRYIKKLGLNKQVGALLDDLYSYSNNFMGIEECAVEVIKLFLSSRIALQKAYSTNQLTQQEQFAKVLDLVARKHYNYRTGSNNYQYILKNNSSILLTFLLKCCEGKLRQHFQYKKLNFLQGYHPDIIAAFQAHVLDFIETKIDERVSAVAQPGEEVQIELNRLLTTRWKSFYQLTEEHFAAVGKEAFINQAQELHRLNSKNPSLELIYLEIAKSLMNKDKQLSLEYFLRYTAQNLSSSRLTLKPMSQAMHKKLFGNSGLSGRYTDILLGLMRKQYSLDQALKEIKDFFLPVRKKIVLSTEVIKKVEVQHSSTVELLNEYLNDEQLPEPANLEAIETKAASNDQEPLPVQSIAYHINFSKLEQNLLSLFTENNFSLQAHRLDDFCKNNGTAKGTLINNINENCYELIDDLLIEFGAEIYTINKNYYQQLLTL